MTASSTQMAGSDVGRGQTTPGPWRLSMRNGERIIVGAVGEGVALIPHLDFGLVDPAERATNAAFIVRACNAHHELLEALVVAEAAIARVTEGDGGMSPARPWRNDGKASKHDRCPHDRWMYEDCDACACAVLDPALDTVRAAIRKATANPIDTLPLGEGM